MDLDPTNGQGVDPAWQQFRKNVAAANRNGLVTTRLSKHKFVVTRFGANLTGAAPLTYHTGDLAFGPASWGDVQDWLDTEVARLHPEVQVREAQHAEDGNRVDASQLQCAQIPATE